jgi:hypothetical protein
MGFFAEIFVSKFAKIFCRDPEETKIEVQTYKLFFLLQVTIYGMGIFAFEKFLLDFPFKRR